MANTSKILSGNRLTIPKEIMKAFKLKIGDDMIVETRGKEIVFIPAEVRPKK